MDHDGRPAYSPSPSEEDEPSRRLECTLGYLAEEGADEVRWDPCCAKDVFLESGACDGLLFMEAFRASDRYPNSGKPRNTGRAFDIEYRPQVAVVRRVPFEPISVDAPLPPWTGPPGSFAAPRAVPPSRAHWSAARSTDGLPMSVPPPPTRLEASYTAFPRLILSVGGARRHTRPAATRQGEAGSVAAKVSGRQTYRSSAPRTPPTQSRSSLAHVGARPTRVCSPLRAAGKSSGRDPPPANKGVKRRGPPGTAPARPTKAMRPGPSSQAIQPVGICSGAPKATPARPAAASKQRSLPPLKAKAPPHIGKGAGGRSPAPRARVGPRQQGAAQVRAGPSPGPRASEAERRPNGRARRQVGPPPLGWDPGGEACVPCSRWGGGVGGWGVNRRQSAAAWRWVPALLVAACMSLRRPV